MSSCLIGLGSNLGDRSAQLHRAVAALSRNPGIEVRAVSSWHETEPVGGPAGQGQFLNGAVLAESSLSPDGLLQAMLAVECQLGRAPRARWDARLIDLDLLLYGDQVLSTDSLQIPHPWLAIRRFVLTPCCEIAPTMVHPTIGWTIRQLLDHLSASAPYIAITGVPGAGKSVLAQGVLSRVAGRMVEGMPFGELAAEPDTDSPRNAWDTEIEFLRYRAKLLDRRVWTKPYALTVSDFWVRQSLAYGQLRFSESQLEDLFGIVSRDIKTVQSPRLLVFLEASPQWLRSCAPTSDRRMQGALSAKELVRLQHCLQAEVDRPGRGPVLRLESSDMPRAISDVVASVAAMA